MGNTENKKKGLLGYAAVMGVIIMRIEEGNSLVSIERVENEESED